MTDDLPNMHDEINEAFARRLQHAMPAMRGVFGHIGSPLKTAAGGHVVSPDAPGLADERANPNGGKSPIV